MTRKLSQNLNMGIKTTQNFTLISKLLRKMRKVANKEDIGKKKYEKLGVRLLLCHGFEISVKFCAFWILVCKKK
jgi:hypothetical protein